jgi:tetratricopeptide (TPR) repeat protein
MLTIYAETAEKGSPSLGKLRSSADSFFTNGQFDESISMWTKVIQMEPGNENNFYKRFRVFLRQKKYKEAISDLTTILTLNPANENALAQRAKLQIKFGKCTEAAQDLEKLKK